MLPAAALFDLDGVLIDSEPEYTRIWNNIVRVYPTGIDNFALKIKGNTLPRILSTYFPDPEIQNAVVAMLKERESAMEYEVFEGVIDFLTELRNNSIPTAIVTSSGQSKMDRLFSKLEGFANYFDVVITDSDTTHSKPHPECYLTAAARLGVNPTECIVFEDSFAGLQAGRDAGARVVAIASTNPRKTLSGKAHVVIDSFVGLSLTLLIKQLLDD